MKDIDFQALLASAYGQQAPVSGANAQNYFDALRQNNTQFMPGFQSAIANQLAQAFGNGLSLGPNPQPTPPPIPPVTDPTPDPTPPQPPAPQMFPTGGGSMQPQGYSGTEPLTGYYSQPTFMNGAWSYPGNYFGR